MEDKKRDIFEHVLRCLDYGAWFYFLLKTSWNYMVMNEFVVSFEDTVFLLVPLGIRVVRIAYKTMRNRYNKTGFEKMRYLLFPLLTTLFIFMDVFVIWHFGLYELSHLDRVDVDKFPMGIFLFAIATVVFSIVLYLKDSDESWGMAIILQYFILASVSGLYSAAVINPIAHPVTLKVWLQGGVVQTFLNLITQPLYIVLLLAQALFL